MSELSYVLELYFANEDDEVAVENVQTGLTVSRFEGGVCPDWLNEAK